MATGIGWSKSLARGVAVAGASLVLLVPLGAASAEGLFGALFGALSGDRPNRESAPNSYADPNARGGRQDNPLANLFGPDGRQRQRERSGQHAGGRGTVFCVRTCDGRYFPMQRHAGTNPAQMCSAMCPAAKTQIFSGGEIDHAVAPNGEKYADSANAFTYRQRIVSDCTCNGKDPFGLAPVDAASDPTLRDGDIVATQTGLMAFKSASRSKRGNEVANFTPVDTSRLSSDIREKLAGIEVSPN